MNTSVTIEQLNPSDIVGIKMDSNRILSMTYNYPILNEDVDYEVALYALDQIRKLEEKNGKCLGHFVDITQYRRLDCVQFFGITIPSPKARGLESEFYKDSIFDRVAIFRKDPFHMIGICEKMLNLANRKELKLFNNREEALKWLEEGVRVHLSKLGRKSEVDKDDASKKK